MSLPPADLRCPAAATGSAVSGAAYSSSQTPTAIHTFPKSGRRALSEQLTKAWQSKDSEGGPSAELTVSLNTVAAKPVVLDQYSPKYRMGGIISKRGDRIVKIAAENLHVAHDNSDLNRWLRELVYRRGSDGVPHIWYGDPWSSKKYYKGVNTRLPVDVVQAYMADTTVVTAPSERGPLSSPRWQEVAHYVMSLKLAGSQLTSSCWFPSTTVSFMQTFQTALA